MAAHEPWSNNLITDFKMFSKDEFTILEVEIFTRLIKELKDVFHIMHVDYFNLMKFSEIERINMIENNFIRFVINDILLTEEYSVQGIACYVETSEEVINDLIIGKNLFPSLQLSQQIIDLHRSVRFKVYDGIMKKIMGSGVSA